MNNSADFFVGQTLQLDEIEVIVQEIRDDAVRVDQLISRRTASNLKSSQVVVDPVIWIKDVLDNWSTFWNRDDSEAFPDGMDRYLNWLP